MPIAGVLPVLHTPYGGDGGIDRIALARERDWVYAAGAHGCCLALVSDLMRLTPAERAAYPALLAELNRGRGMLVISVGAETAADACRFAQE
ncbi:MAG: dihydrodipicolinate synthase family protein, partial [bacterium]